jgi:asparagine synthetase B (glutamine-hydrolysing)
VVISGGLDSTILAALADEVLPKNEPIDLLNVAFEQQDHSFHVPDRLTAIQALSGQEM